MAQGKGWAAGAGAVLPGPGGSGAEEKGAAGRAGAESGLNGRDAGQAVRREIGPMSPPGSAPHMFMVLLIGRLLSSVGGRTSASS